MLRQEVRACITLVQSFVFCLQKAQYTRRTLNLIHLIILPSILRQKIACYWQQSHAHNSDLLLILTPPPPLSIPHTHFYQIPLTLLLLLFFTPLSVTLYSYFQSSLLLYVPIHKHWSIQKHSLARLYGCETWSVILKKYKLRSLENRVLRKVFGPKGDEVIGH